MTEGSGLNVRDVLKQTYSELQRRNNAKGLALERKAHALIADDSDWHRTRKGFMGYEKAVLLELGDHLWAIARGEAYGDYPAEPYDSDIMALKIERSHKQLDRELVTLIEDFRNGFFRNSLFVGLSAGELGFGKRFSPDEKVNDEADRFMQQRPEYDRRVIMASTLTHPVRKIALYKPELVSFLADYTERVLRESS